MDGDVIQVSLSGTEKKPTEPDTVNAVVGNSEDMIPEGNFPSSILSEVFPRQQNRFRVPGWQKFRLSTESQ